MIDLIRTRRSIRKFTDQPVETEKVELLKEAVLRSPTSKNSTAWEFIFINEPAIIRELAHCRPSGAGSLLTASLAVVALANESHTGAWIEDCSIASAFLQLTVHSLNLGSCWIQIRGRDYDEKKSSEAFVHETLNIPDEFRVLNIVAIGYPQRLTEGKPLSDLDFGKIHINGF